MIETPTQGALQLAEETRVGSLRYNAAVELCYFRGVDPFAWSPNNMDNWRAAVVEGILLNAIAWKSSAQ